MADIRTSLLLLNHDQLVWIIKYLAKRNPDKIAQAIKALQFEEG